MNALHCACEASRLEVVEMLLDAGALVDPIDSFSRTPLILSCQKGDEEIVQVLVRHGANVNHNFGTAMPWEIAWTRQETRTALFLLSQPQTEVDSNSRLLQQALGWAAALGEMKACRKLVEAGAPLHLKNADGLTPSQIARNWEMDEIEAYLLEQETARRVAFPKLLEQGNQTEEVLMIEQTRDSLEQPLALPPAMEDVPEVTQPSEVPNISHSTPPAQEVKANKGRSPMLPAPIVLAVLGVLAALLAALISFTIPPTRCRHSESSQR